MNSFPRERTLFESVATKLRTRIDAGEWASGVRLPTEKVLAEQFSVGLNTVRRAVEILVSDGLVVRRQGSGTYVTQRPETGSRFVGAIVPSTSYYFPTVIAGIERATGAAGVRMLLASSDYDHDRELVRIREMIDSGVSGLLIAPTLHLGDAEAQLDAIRGLGVPTVLVERRPSTPEPDDRLSYIVTDVVGGGFAAVRHLVEQGCTRIGFMGRSDTATADDVFDGFERAIAAFDVPNLADAIMRRPSWGREELAGYAAIAKEQRLDGVFCLGDREATALIRRLRAQDISVPDDLAVICYDDEVAGLAEVPLTAVSPPKFEVGRLAANTLLRLIATQGAAAAVRTRLLPSINVRESSRSRL
ncbi:GntR family transcriptional regulator [Microbacterium sp. ARD32]|uniref:GntR family transcriptional regulator n=1 Tax=Microbacterium sp. ARD32 TaxID=2962577 RepID=UPI0028823723|nr:GntR family transcriptional regulator [Microbacterium sp. ARD32]MDT0157666.1 GntR family transcriptional regulator [Microbacterium sp. ARD32]